MLTYILKVYEVMLRRRIETWLETAGPSNVQSHIAAIKKEGCCHTADDDVCTNPKTEKDFLTLSMIYVLPDSKTNHQDLPQYKVKGEGLVSFHSGGFVQANNQVSLVAGKKRIPYCVDVFRVEAIQAQRICSLKIALRRRQKLRQYRHSICW